MNTPVKVIVAIIVAQALPALADMVAYGGKHSLSITNDVYIVNHTHDWSAGQLHELYSDLDHHERFFTKANNFSRITVLERATGREIFSSPSPAITYLWLSPDSRYLVCLSSIMLRNPYQLVIWDLRTKSLVWKEHIAATVAVLTKEKMRDFYQQFPKAERHLSPRTRVAGPKMIVDYSALGMPNTIGDEAFMYLLGYDKPHPYSTNFSQSVTNSVHWYYGTPEIALVEAKRELVLSLLDPEQKRIFIHVPIPRG
jgi:hypothetical protein